MKKVLLYKMIIAFLIIALLFFVILYANQKKQNNSTVHQNNIYVAELEKQQNISRQLTNYRNDPDIPRLNFDQEINEEVVSSFLQEVDYRFVIEGIENEDLSMLQRILSSVENYEEVDLRFRDIEKIDDLSIVLSILDRNNTQYLSITFGNKNTDLQLGIIQDIIQGDSIESYSFYNVLINQQFLEYIKELDVFSLYIEGIYDSNINDQVVAQAMNSSGISEFSINSLIMQSAGVSNSIGEIILEKNK